MLRMWPSYKVEALQRSPGIRLLGDGLVRALSCCPSGTVAVGRCDMIVRPEVLPGLIRQSSLPPLHRLVLLTLDAIVRARLPDPKTAEVARFCGVGHRTVRGAL